jgi:hypothetical protein
MGTKSKSAKKPKLAGRPSGNSQDQIPTAMTGGNSPSSQEGSDTMPRKHKMSFAQHQHELQHQAKSPAHK